jgi:Fe2+ or Zn2+ uptake regulation protein
MNNNLEDLLATSSLRVTQPRKTIFQTLKNAPTPLSHVEISKANSSIDKTSVYRTIELFLRLGVIVGVSHGWKQKYELAAPFRPHHHHLHCIKCGKIEEIQSEKLEQMIHAIADDSNFHVVGHTFELTGICNQCYK